MGSSVVSAWVGMVKVRVAALRVMVLVPVWLLVRYWPVWVTV